MTQSSFQRAFGPGFLKAYRTDIANSTPVQFGGFQSGDISFDSSLKALTGQGVAPIDYGRGAIKISGKIKAAEINAQLFNDLFLGGTVATGQTNGAFNEAHSVPAMTTYTVTATNAATFQTDLGVTYANYYPFEKVASSPTVGQYSVVPATGVYTFSASDASANILLNYTYSVASTGKLITMPNLLQGTMPYFQVVFNTFYAGQQVNMTINRCVSSKLSFSSKTGDWIYPELDFEAMDDGSGGLVSISSVAG